MVNTMRTLYTPQSQVSAVTAMTTCAFTRGQLENYPSTANELLLQETVYEALFETLLERLLDGEYLEDIVASDPRGISQGRLMKWIMKAPGRKKRYFETRSYFAETMVSQTIKIIDGKDDPTEELRRSEARVRARQWAASKWSPDRYGDKKDGVVPQVNVIVNRGVTLQSEKGDTLVIDHD